MTRTLSFIAAFAVATLVLPAAAGSWPPAPSSGKTAAKAVLMQTRHGEMSPATRLHAESNVASGANAAATAKVVNGFQYIGGEGGWQVAQHKYVLSNGRLVHSNECVHAYLTAARSNPAEIDGAQGLYPGA
jgi:hypothetical protein